MRLHRLKIEHMLLSAFAGIFIDRGHARFYQFAPMMADVKLFAGANPAR